jgi:hypothetical protein
LTPCPDPAPDLAGAALGQLKLSARSGRDDMHCGVFNVCEVKTMEDGAVQ